MTSENGNGWRGWRIEVAQATVRQGPIGVILLCVMYAIWHWGNWLLTTGVPLHLSAIQSGYVDIQKSHDKNIAASLAADEKRTKDLVSVIERTSENMKKSSENIEKLIIEFLAYEKQDDQAMKELVKEINQSRGEKENVR